MASLVHLAPLHYSVETPVFGESHKVEEADSASLLNACQPVQKMTENGRQQRGNGTFDWDLIANFWLMRGMRRVPLPKKFSISTHFQNLTFFYFVWSLYSAQLIKPIRQSDSSLLLWVLGEGLYGVGGKKWRKALTSRDKWGVVFSPWGHPSSHCRCQVSIFLSWADRAVFFCSEPEQMPICELQKFL